MKPGQSTPPYRRASGSSLIEALAKALTDIKDEDNLTDAELGRMLGKSGQDQGKAYRTGFTEMPVTSFLRGCETWNGRFASKALALIGMKLAPLENGSANDRSLASALTKLLLQMSVALEDGKIDDDELAMMQAELKGSYQAVYQMRRRLAEQAA